MTAESVIFALMIFLISQCLDLDRHRGRRRRDRRGLEARLRRVDAAGHADGTPGGGVFSERSRAS